ncbi:MAG TPA: isoprenylcysteine carboxylmethyltransferase family protein [Anaerolineaceae bacterium]|nr:isoprenylcysteine carboxylmethyltransferase family protein [Anaerolineaceae bacterium]
MKNKLVEQAKHEYTPRQRLIFLLFLAPVFLGLLPGLFLALGSSLDRWLQLPQIPTQPFNIILGAVLILPGGAFALWSIYRQYTIGRGTPGPLVATQQLVVQPPYTYCRNPMALGTILAYLGVSVLCRTPGGMAVVLLFSGLLLIYIKQVEEEEMILRFGPPYLAYKERTPFLIPHFTLKSNQKPPD